MPDQVPAVTNSLVDAVIKFWKELGVLAVVLAVYMGQDAGVIPDPTVTELKEIKRELQEVKGQGIAHDSSMKELTRAVEEQGEQLSEQRKAWQKRCVMRAKTDQEKQECFVEGK